MGSVASAQTSGYMNGSHTFDADMSTPVSDIYSKYSAELLLDVAQQIFNRDDKHDYTHWENSGHKSRDLFDIFNPITMLVSTHPVSRHLVEISSRNMHQRRCIFQWFARRYFSAWMPRRSLCLSIHSTLLVTCWSLTHAFLDAHSYFLVGFDDAQAHSNLVQLRSGLRISHQTVHMAPRAITWTQTARFSSYISGGSEANIYRKLRRIPEVCMGTWWCKASHSRIQGHSQRWVAYGTDHICWLGSSEGWGATIADSLGTLVSHFLQFVNHLLMLTVHHGAHGMRRQHAEVKSSNYSLHPGLVRRSSQIRINDQLWGVKEWKRCQVCTNRWHKSKRRLSFFPTAYLKPQSDTLADFSAHTNWAKKNIPFCCRKRRNLQTN